MSQRPSRAVLLFPRLLRFARGLRHGRVLLACAFAAGAHQPAPGGQERAQAIPPATLDDTLEVAGEELKARRVETRMILPVRVNGQGPFRFVVDSGADRSVIGRGVAERLAVPAGAPVRLTGVVETAIVPTVRVDALRLGLSEITDLQMPALHERDIGADGIVGIDALAEQRLMMDFERRRVTIEDVRHRIPTLPGDIVVTARRQNGQLIITQVAASGRNVLAVIDSGAMISIGNTALMRKVFGRRAPKLRMTEMIGVTGATRMVPIAILPELQIGPLVMLNVPMAFADLPPFARFGLTDEPAVLLGTDTLQAFARVSLDFRRRKVRFQLRHREGTGVSFH